MIGRKLGLRQSDLDYSVSQNDFYIMGALKTTNADPFESLNVEPARPTEPIKSLKGIILHEDPINDDSSESEAEEVLGINGPVHGRGSLDSNAQNNNNAFNPPAQSSGLMNVIFIFGATLLGVLFVVFTYFYACGMNESEEIDLDTKSNEYAQLIY